MSSMSVCVGIRTDGETWSVRTLMRKIRDVIADAIDALTWCRPSPPAAIRPVRSMTVPPGWKSPPQLRREWTGAHDDDDRENH